MRRLVVLDVSVRLIFHAVLITSIYLLLAGHNQPGGGFVAGLIAIFLIGAALDLQLALGVSQELYSPSAFRVAMATQLLVTAVGSVLCLLSARRLRGKYGAQAV